MPTAEAPPRSELKTERQRELMRIVESKFEDFAKRGQLYYALMGMSTHHVVNAVIADIQSLKAFWPKDRIREGGFGSGISYLLEDDVMEKTQNAVRDTLKQLAERGHLERVGNEHERRWRPLGILSNGQIVRK